MQMTLRLSNEDDDGLLTAGHRKSLAYGIQVSGADCYNCFRGSNYDFIITRRWSAPLG